MRVGNIVKSYDFPHRKDCFIIGEVTSVDYLQKTINLKAAIRVIEGKIKEINVTSNNYNGIVFSGEGIFGTDYSKMVEVVA
jgi:hypothetical protein